MSHGFTEKDLVAAGFVQGRDGNWSKPDVQDRDPRPVPAVEQPALDEPAQADGSEKGVPRPLLASPVGIIVISHRQRAHDPDGICAKYFIDQLVEHRIIEDDKQEHVAWVRLQACKCGQGEERTVIEVVELKPGVGVDRPLDATQDQEVDGN